MPPEIVAVAADHGGFEMKQALARTLADDGHRVIDLGTHSTESVDYPEIADALAAELKAGPARFGVLMCGTGIGISIAANRHRHLRAALCRDVTEARLARQHNDANVLVMGGRTMGIETARDCLRTFLATEFEGGRHQRRVARLA